MVFLEINRSFISRYYTSKLDWLPMQKYASHIKVSIFGKLVTINAY